MASNSTTPLTFSDRFEILQTLGDGSFGTVTRARVRASGFKNFAAPTRLRPNMLVAIKSMKKIFANPADYLRLREVRFLRALPPHPNLVRAQEIFLDLSTKRLHIVMECLQVNLFQYINLQHGEPLHSSVVQGILLQIVNGVQHIHANGYFHRDLKPENILVQSSPNSAIPTVKVSDFGLVREINSAGPYTTYVSTRWYRSPEILLKTGAYGPAVDMWALGALAVELATLRPLFPGQNEWDQIWKICETMGTPDTPAARGGAWPDARAHSQRQGFMLPTGRSGRDMHDVVRAHACPQSSLSEQFELAALADWATGCLQWDPLKRMTVAEAIHAPYFTGKTRAATDSVADDDSSCESDDWSTDDTQVTRTTCSSAGTDLSSPCSPAPFRPKPMPKAMACAECDTETIPGLARSLMCRRV